MSERAKEVRRWTFFIVMLLFWFATLGIFSRYAGPGEFPGAVFGAVVVTIVAGFCFLVTFVDN